MEWTTRLEGKTGWGEVETVELVRITRPVLAATADDVGRSLGEAKSLLARLQETMVRGQVAEYLQVCPDCLTFRPQALFGTVDVEAPRYRICRCRPPPCVDERPSRWSANCPVLAIESTLAFCPMSVPGIDPMRQELRTRATHGGRLPRQIRGDEASNSMLLQKLGPQLLLAAQCGDDHLVAASSAASRRSIFTYGQRSCHCIRIVRRRLAKS
jgi:hypothetical protein